MDNTYHSCINSSIISQNNETIPVDVVIPRLEIKIVSVQIPWIVKNESITKIRLPYLHKEIIPVYRPYINKYTGEISYMEEGWQQQIVTYLDGLINGRIKYHKTEDWQETHIVYSKEVMYKRATFPQFLIEPKKLQVNPLERISMTILGGSYEEIQEIHSSDYLYRSGIRVEHKGLSGVFSPIFDLFSIIKS